MIVVPITPVVPISSGETNGGFQLSEELPRDALHVAREFSHAVRHGGNYSSTSTISRLPPVGPFAPINTPDLTTRSPRPSKRSRTRSTRPSPSRAWT